ncbi:MAG: hypothetical protein IT288_00895 [Bdellovibrionales bacterium]|nr:hypothetical protein [Bdellovibrionales bacterium]
MRLGLLVATLLLSLGCDSAGHYHSGASLNPLDSIERWGTCDHTGHIDPESRLCREWIGDFWGAEDLEQSCTKLSNGIFSKTPCSTNQLVGVCVTDKGTEAEVRYFYYVDDWTATSGKANCDAKNLAAQGLGTTVSEWILP